MKTRSLWGPEGRMQKWSRRTMYICGGLVIVLLLIVTAVFPGLTWWARVGQMAAFGLAVFGLTNSIREIHAIYPRYWFWKAIDERLRAGMDGKEPGPRAQLAVTLHDPDGAVGLVVTNAPARQATRMTELQAEEKKEWLN